MRITKAELTRDAILAVPVNTHMTIIDAMGIVWEHSRALNDPRQLEYQLVRTTLKELEASGHVTEDTCAGLPKVYIRTESKEITGVGREQQSCGLCGEPINYVSGFPKEEAGEFWNEDTRQGVIAHAQCGLGANLELA